MIVSQLISLETGVTIILNRHGFVICTGHIMEVRWNFTEPLLRQVQVYILRTHCPYWHSWQMLHYLLSEYELRQLQQISG